jgi:hypothetical protein
MIFRIGLGIKAKGEEQTLQRPGFYRLCDAGVHHGNCVGNFWNQFAALPCHGASLWISTQILFTDTVVSRQKIQGRFFLQFDIGPIVEGVVFAIAYLAYAGMSPIWGYVFRKVHIDYRWVLVGPLMVGIIWMILGPIPILSFIGTEYVLIDSLIC